MGNRFGKVGRTRLEIRRMIQILYWIIYGIVMFATFKTCEHVWNKMKKKKMMEQEKSCEPREKVELVINEERMNQNKNLSNGLVSEEQEKNVIVNNYQFR